MNDVLLNKKESIERCVKQIKNYYDRPSDIAFMHDYLRQDAIAINLQRACQQCIDMANHAIRVKKLGIPKDSRESFRLLAAHHIIPAALAHQLESMVGFRNTLVHEYQNLNLQIMIGIIENHLHDLIDYTNFVLKAFNN